MLAAMLAVTLAQTTPDAAGAVEAAFLTADRQAPRLRWGLAGGGIAGAGGAESYQLLNLGVGLAFDVGVLLNDRIGVTFRATADTILVLSQALGAVMAEFHADTVMIGGGLGVVVPMLLDRSLSARPAIAIPLVVGFTPAGRDAAAVARRGFTFGFEAGVGVFPGSAATPTRAMVWGGIRIGFAVR